MNRKLASIGILLLLVAVGCAVVNFTSINAITEANNQKQIAATYYASTLYADYMINIASLSYVGAVISGIIGGSLSAVGLISKQINSKDETQGADK